MARPGELAFFSSRSGLPSGASLSAHKMAYYATKGQTVGSLRFREYQFYLAQTGLPAGTSFQRAKYAYFDANVAGTGGHIDALQVAFYANPPAP